MRIIKAAIPLLFISACGATSVSQPQLGGSPSIIPLPMLSEAARILMISANNKVLDECMVDHGFSGYHTVNPKNLRKNQYSDAIPDLGVLDSDPLQRGYSLQKLIRDAAQIDGPKYPLDDPYLKSLPESELTRMSAVMWGTKIVSVPSATGGLIRVRADGCAHDADAAVYPRGWEELDVLRDGLLGTALSSTYSDPNFSKSLTQWKECINTAGFEADRPKLLQDSIAMKYQNKELKPEKVHQIEVSAAQADFECQKSSGYAKVAVPTLVSEMQRVIADHALELDQLRRIELTAVNNAKKILGGSK